MAVESANAPVCCRNRVRMFCSSTAIANGLNRLCFGFCGGLCRFGGFGMLGGFGGFGCRGGLSTVVGFPVRRPWSLLRSSRSSPLRAAVGSARDHPGVRVNTSDGGGGNPATEARWMISDRIHLGMRWCADGGRLMLPWPAWGEARQRDERCVDSEY